MLFITFCCYGVCRNKHNCKMDTSLNTIHWTIKRYSENRVTQRVNHFRGQTSSILKNSKNVETY